MLFVIEFSYQLYYNILIITVLSLAHDTRKSDNNKQ